MGSTFFWASLFYEAIALQAKALYNKAYDQCYLEQSANLNGVLEELVQPYRYGV